MPSLWTTGKRCVLITGGGSGIGLAIAKKLAALGHDVIVAGRRLSVLEAVQTETPSFKIIQADVSTEEGRVKLFNDAVEKYPQLDVFINNAGTYKHLPPIGTPQDWQAHKDILATNLDAPIHLSLLFVPHLLTKSEAQILFVSSWLGVIPFPGNCTYCASKAGLRSFAFSLRYQLRKTSVVVIDIVPPHVRTDMSGDSGGESLEDYSSDVIEKLLAGGRENDVIAYKLSDQVIRADKAELDTIFNGFMSKFGGDL